MNRLTPARSMCVLFLGINLLSAGGVAGCSILAPTPVAATDDILSLMASPETIPPYGTAAITLRGLHPSGLPLPENTRINFFTTLGQIDEVALTDADGLAHVVLEADASTGSATITASSGACAPASVTITIASQLTAAFSNETNGLTVLFSDASEGAAQDWHWSFGDGQESTEQEPAHVYSAPGTYVVSLTVANDTESDTDQQFITLEQQ